MDYLMTLLREYEKTIRTRKKFPYGNYNNVINNRFMIISKEYWFIDWLVKNDKINIANFLDSTEMPLRYVDWWSDIKMYPIYDSLLMILAIQDNQIEYLCSILK